MAVVRVLASFQYGAVLIWPWCTSFLLVKFVAGSRLGQRVFSRFSDHFVYTSCFHRAENNSCVVACLDYWPNKF